MINQESHKSMGIVFLVLLCLILIGCASNHKKLKTQIIELKESLSRKDEEIIRLQDSLKEKDSKIGELRKKLESLGVFE